MLESSKNLAIVEATVSWSVLGTLTPRATFFERNFIIHSKEKTAQNCVCLFVLLGENTITECDRRKPKKLYHIVSQFVNSKFVQNFNRKASRNLYNFILDFSRILRYYNNRKREEPLSECSWWITLTKVVN